MLKTLLAPALLLTTGAAGSGTITYLSKDQNRNKNSNNFIIYSFGEKGEILIGNEMQEEVKLKRGNLKMIGNIDREWKSVQAKDEKDSSQRFLFWLLGEDQREEWWNFFIAKESGWTLEKQKRQQLAGSSKWSEITKTEEKSKKNKSSEIYLAGITCEKLVELIKKGKKIEKYWEQKINSEGITINCKNKSPQI
ncbi:hypothetical protein [Mycoplasma suis]|uniref:Uncharacterized protein n=1 Tax=Mycoplasma suis (strain Illinois) TaxID=768700 RepID=F0QQV8_MYCSL|nr:hypothetical protein [Mycoplasma suis]ADX97878.1 hypothetical protein MSU_0336 [Mycoplasma suis str. Illinois]